MKHAFVLVTLCSYVTLFTFSTGALPAPIAGDVDLSGGVDAIDVQLVINGALGLPASAHTDVSYDTATDAVDVQLVINAALSVDIDSDDDGLCDIAEAEIGTEPTLFDTDGDGTGDGAEVLNGTNPLGPEVLEVTLHADPPVGPVPHTVLLASSVQGNTTMLTFSWDYGDGQSTTADERVLHTYEDEGAFTATVTVSDGVRSAEATVAVTVAPLPDEHIQIGPGGGTVQLGRCTVDVAADIAPTLVDFSITELPSMASSAASMLDPETFKPIGPAYRVDTPLKSAEPFSVTLAYEPDEMPPGFDPEHLAVMFRMIVTPETKGSDVPDNRAPLTDYVPVPADVDTQAHTVQFEAYLRGTYQVVAMAEPLNTFESPVTKAASSKPYIGIFKKTPTDPTAYAAAVGEAVDASYNTLVLQKGFPAAPGTLKVVIEQMPNPSWAGYINTGDPLTIHLDYQLSVPDKVKKTFAHEFFHTLQFYNSNWFSSANFSSADQWFIEGSAEWACDEVFDSIPDDYSAPFKTRFSTPLNEEGSDGRREYETVAFWKWAETFAPGVLYSTVMQQRSLTHVQIQPVGVVENNISSSYSDVFLSVWPDVDFLWFATSALYWRDFETDETRDGDLWDSVLGSLDAEFYGVYQYTMKSSDTEENPHEISFIRLEQYLTADTIAVRTDGLSGWLHIRFPQMPSGVAWDAAVIVHERGNKAALADVTVRDLSQSHGDVRVYMPPNAEAAIILVDPRWMQDPTDTENDGKLQLWLESPCGDLPGTITDVDNVPDLVDAVKTLAPGNTIRLAPGTYNIPGSEWPPWTAWLGLLMRGLSLVGAGRTETILVLGDSGSIATEGDSSIRDLTIIGEGVLPNGAIKGNNIDSLILCNVNVFMEEYFATAAMKVDAKNSGFLYLNNCMLTCQSCSSVNGISLETPDLGETLTAVILNTDVSGWMYGVRYWNGDPDDGVTNVSADCDGFSGNWRNVYEILLDGESGERCP